MTIYRQCSPRYLTICSVNMAQFHISDLNILGLFFSFLVFILKTLLQTRQTNSSVFPPTLLLLPPPPSRYHAARLSSIHQGCHLPMLKTLPSTQGQQTCYYSDEGGENKSTFSSPHFKGSIFSFLAFFLRLSQLYFHL